MPKVNELALAEPSDATRRMARILGTVWIPKPKWVSPVETDSERKA